jgi:hypothetical protein
MKKLILIILMLISIGSFSQTFNKKSLRNIPEKQRIEKVIIYDSSYMIDNIDSIIVVYLPNKTIFRKAKNINYYISRDITRQEFRIINSDKKVIATFYDAKNASEYIQFKERK